MSSMPATARAAEVSRDALSARRGPAPVMRCRFPSKDYVFAREQNAQNHGKCGLLAQLAQVLPTAHPHFTLVAPSQIHMSEGLADQGDDHGGKHLCQTLACGS